jgi:hypothetical protein
MTKKSGRRRGVVLKFHKPQPVRPNAVVAANTFEAVARKKDIMTIRESTYKGAVSR